MRMKDGRMKQTIDSCFPTSTSSEAITAQLKKVAGSAAAVEHVSAAEPFYISADAAPIHGANEGANLEQLLQALKIYIVALVELQKLDL